MSIKTIATVWILWAQVAILSNALFEDLVARQPLVIQTLKRVLAP